MSLSLTDLAKIAVASNMTQPVQPTAEEMAEAIVEKIDESNREKARQRKISEARSEFREVAIWLIANKFKDQSPPAREPTDAELDTLEKIMTYRSYDQNTKLYVSRIKQLFGLDGNPLKISPETTFEVAAKQLEHSVEHLNRGEFDERGFPLPPVLPKLSATRSVLTRFIWATILGLCLAFCVIVFWAANSPESLQAFLQNSYVQWAMNAILYTIAIIFWTIVIRILLSVSW